MQVATPPAIYRHFFTEKTPEKAKLVETQATWTGDLNWSEKAMKKLGPIKGC